MEFIKNYNNNAALVKDSAGKDWVVIGKGIGFGLKKGMPVDESKIERRFLAQDETDQVEPEVVKGHGQPGLPNWPRYRSEEQDWRGNLNPHRHGHG